jgi:mono/diheme cytochrome c family protein
MTFIITTHDSNQHAGIFLILFYKNLIKGHLRFTERLSKAKNMNTPTFSRYSFFMIRCIGLLLVVHGQTMAQSKPWVVPADAAAVKNPLSGNTSVIPEGKTIYVANCGPCHGEKGRGDGPAAAGLNPKPADHSSALIQSETDGSLFWKLSEGRAPMPAYKKVFTDQQRWELINYIRTLGRTVKK